MFRSITAKLIFFFMLFFCLIEGIQLLCIYLFFNDAFLNQKISTIQQAYDEINDDQLDNTTIFEDTVAVMQEYETTTNLYFCIMDRKSGGIRYSTNDSIQEHISFTKVKDERYDAEDDAQVISGYNSNDWVVLYRTIETEEHIYNVVIWTCYEAEFNNTILGLSPIFFLIILLSAIVGGIFAFWLAAHIVSPIRDIDRATQKIAQQDFSSKVTVPKSKDELNRLATNINIMSEQLEDDMTALKTANEQLELDIQEKIRIDKMRQDFLSNVSHELKTPLAIISSYAEMLKYEGENINKEEYLDVILDESQQMSQMIGKLLNLSRLEHATEHIEKNVVPFSNLVQNLADSRRILFEQSNLSFQSNITSDLTVLGDENYLSQVVDNFLGNALKYTTPQGSVSLKLTEENNTVHLQIENDSTPLSDELLQNIWENFYKGDKSRNKDRNMSVGLGLYIVKTIITAHEGEYGAYNTDTGVCFWIRIKSYTSHESITSD